MKSTLTGLCKLSSTPAPREEDLEVQAMDAFVRSGRSEGGKITLLDIIKYCTENPECRSWMEYYDDPHEMELNKQEVLAAEIDYSAESQFPPPPPEVTAAADCDKFAFANGAALEAQLDSPWVSTIQSLVPTQYVNERVPASAPDSMLKLEWVHGYRSEDCRNNVRYSSDGSICYHGKEWTSPNPPTHEPRPDN